MSGFSAIVIVILIHGVIHILSFIYIRKLKVENERLANNLWDIALVNAEWAKIHAKKGFPELDKHDEDQ